jgi:hypothetical protein
MINIITIHDKEFNIIYANDEAKQLLKLPSSGRRKKKCYEYFHGKGYVPDVCAGLKCFLTDYPVDIKIYEPFLNKFLEIRATPLYGVNQEPFGVFHVAREMQPLHIAEKSNKNLINIIPNF